MKMQSKILALALAPLLGLGLAVILIGNNRIGDALTESIKNGLRASAVAVRETLEHADEGEFRVDGGVLYKGEFNVSEASEIADHIKQATDIDITVFYGPTRYMTSIVDAQGIVLWELRRTRLCWTGFREMGKNILIRISS